MHPVERALHKAGHPQDIKKIINTEIVCDRGKNVEQLGIEPRTSPMLREHYTTKPQPHLVTTQPPSAKVWRSGLAAPLGFHGIADSMGREYRDCSQGGLGGLPDIIVSWIQGELEEQHHGGQE